jgi:hypothetical protein
MIVAHARPVLFSPSGAYLFRFDVLLQTQFLLVRDPQPADRTGTDLVRLLSLESIGSGASSSADIDPKKEIDKTSVSIIKMNQSRASGL